MSDFFFLSFALTANKGTTNYCCNCNYSSTLTLNKLTLFLRRRKTLRFRGLS